MKMKSKKGQVAIQQLVPIAIAFVVIAVVISMGAKTLGAVRDSFTDNTSYEWNATVNGLDGLDELGSWLPTIAIVIAAAVIIGVIVVYFRQ